MPRATDRQPRRGFPQWTLPITTFALVALMSGAILAADSTAADEQKPGPPGVFDADFVPTVPCRLLDTRTDEIGARATPLGPRETFAIRVRGAQGNCELPDHTVALSVNVTAANPTEQSFLTVYPGNTPERPTSSNLNWRAGQSPVANAFDVKVSTSGVGGILVFYNHSGTVDVIADVVGFYPKGTLADPDTRVNDNTRRTLRLGLNDGGDRRAGVHKVTATATVVLGTDGVDAGRCTVTGETLLVGEAIEFSDEGVPTSRMRIPLTVVQVREWVHMYGSDVGSFELACTTTSGSFEVLNDSVVVDTFQRHS